MIARLLITIFLMLGVFIPASAPPSWDQPALAGILDGTKEFADEAGLNTSDDPESAGTEALTAVINTFLSLVGLIALFFIIYGGVMYMAAIGDDSRAQKAKMIIFYAIVGLVVVLLAAVIYNFVVDALSGGSETEPPPGGNDPIP